MLEKDRRKRLGQQNDVADIINHPWFADLDIKSLMAKKLEAPFIPAVANNLDLNNFDKEVTGQTLAESIVPADSI